MLSIMAKFFVSPRTTVLLTTANRPEELERLFTFWGKTGLERPVIVLDSSPPEIAARNRETCGRFRFPDPILYHSFPETVYPFEKWHRSMAEVTTPYVIFAAEDDFLIPSSLAQCEEFLDRNGDYAVCQGFYLSFRKSGNVVRLFEDSFTTSNDANTPEERLLKQFSHYGHFTYGLRRTSLWNEWPKSIQDAAEAIPVEAGGVQEMTDAMLCLISGKVKRLPVLQIMRNGQPTPEDSWKKTFVFGPNFSRTILSFKTILSEALSVTGRRSRENNEFLLDECLRIYFSTLFKTSERQDLPADFPVLKSPFEDRKELKAIIEAGDFKFPEFKSVLERLQETPVEHDLAKTVPPPLGTSRYQTINWLNSALAATPSLAEIKLHEMPAMIERRNRFREVMRHPRKSFASAVKIFGRYLSSR
jgi:glycosyltransferase domain-containing protein